MSGNSDALISAWLSDLTVNTVSKCAEIAEEQRYRQPQTEWQSGYNQAVRDIAGKIRRLA